MIVKLQPFEDVFPELESDFGGGPSRVLRSIRAEHESESTTALLHKLMGDDSDELLKAGSPSAIGEAIRIASMPVDPIEIFSDESLLELVASDPRSRKLAKSQTDDEEAWQQYLRGLSPEYRLRKVARGRTEYQLAS
jgi:hypothetical protein